MKPTKTCHIIRATLKHLGVVQRTTPDGLPETDLPLPRFDSLDSDKVRHDWFAYNLIRKREVDRPETEAAARAAFAESEARCAAIELEGLTLDSEGVQNLILASQICHDILGDKPPANWHRECTFTGGASTSRSRQSSHPALKWWARPSLHVTPLALTHLLDLAKDCEVIQVAWRDPGILSSYPGYHVEASAFTVVPGSRIDFVEKNYKTKRTILIEPDGNMLLQKGVGNVIRRLLRVAGINLNSQTRNQRLAFAGSITGLLGTIDISAASDSVTLALLRILLPWEWYRLIYELRSPLYRDGDTWKKMHKVSSMGNGFTFELESLVFYCLTKAVATRTKPCDPRIGIYGDDIIVGTEACDTLVSFLNQCGFSINTEKSFWTGYFRESCGKHYHNGADVTPVYVKSDLDVMPELFRLYNQVRSWAGGLYYDPRYKLVLDTILDHIPLRDRVQVPVEFGPNAGLWYRDVSTVPLTLRFNKHGHSLLSFTAWEEESHDFSDRWDDECRWLYRHMERWVPSCPIGTSEYTSLTSVRKGKWGRRKRVIPASSVEMA